MPTSEGKEFMAGALEGENVESVKASNSIITSATQILKEGEHQWLNSEVTIIYSFISEYGTSPFFIINNIKCSFV